MKSALINNKLIQFPIYLPDATRGVTKSLDSQDLKNINIEGAVVNTYHLMETPGLPALRDIGGVKKFMNFDGLIVSDSGGWQVFSLIHRNKSGGSITDDGVTFNIGVKNKQLFSPEDSIRAQFDIGSDIIICLDDFTPPDASDEYIKQGIERTLLWAKRCKTEYTRQLELRNLDKNEKGHSPMLFAVIQGGWNKELRKYCAEKLIEIGFDGYGYGGYAIDDTTHKLDLEISEYIVNLIPQDKIRFALGFGKPHDIAALYQMGWQIFDCTLPTRDARHKRLYTYTRNPQTLEDLLDPSLHAYINLAKTSLQNDQTPATDYCDCLTCKNYSKAYLHHLFAIGETSAYRLASIHNLRHYTKLIEMLRTKN